MIIIGEKLNSSIPKTLEAINTHDEDYIINLIHEQEKCGADYLDINTAISGENELSNMLWIIELVIKYSKCNIMIDSPNVEVIKETIKFADNRKIIINSITLNQRVNELLSTIKKYNAYVVCLPIGEDGMPKTAIKRLENSKVIVEKLLNYGINEDRIYIDALAEALCVGDRNAIIALDTIRMIKSSFQKVKTICGISNISFGLPKRVNINSAFLSMALFCGLDSAIIDITSEKMRETLFTSMALSGSDDYCMNYINFTRNTANTHNTQRNESLRFNATDI